MAVEPCGSEAQAKIVSRIERLGLGNPGDVKPVGEGLSEMRISHSPGTEFTSSKPTRPSFFFCVVEINRPKRGTSNGRKK
jgi:hypothetical protein